MPKNDLSERQQAILGQLEVTGKVVVADLAAEHAVSDVTIRKDLQDLELQNLLKRVHGGAVLTGRAGWNPSIARRVEVDAAAKAAMADAALRFVHDGDTIILDAGTSTLALARRLRGRFGNLTVITNNFLALAELADVAGIELIALGGSVRSHSLAIIGPLAVAGLERLHADVAFLGATGADEEGGLCTPNLIEAETKAAMVRSARECVALVEHDKLGAASLARFCGWHELDVLVTSAQPPKRLGKHLASKAVEVVVARPAGAPRGPAALGEEGTHAPPSPVA